MKNSEIHNLFLDLEKRKKILPGPYWIEVLRGDVSHRIYYRVYSKESSFVLCYDQRSIGLNEEDMLFLFFQKFLKRNNIQCPAIIEFNLDKGWVIQEDLGSTDLLQYMGDKSEELILDNYKNALKLLEKLHFCNDESIDKTIQLSFDNNKLMSEIDMTIKYFAQNYLKINDSNYLKNLRLEFEKIISKITSKPKVPTHRDYHSRNIMVHKDQLYMIDFQDIRWGLPQYDLVSILHDCYFTLSEKNRDELINYYWLRNKDKLSGFSSKEEFIYYYDLMAVQRIFKAIGSFCFIYIDFKRINYLQYIGSAMENLRAILSKYPEFKYIQKLIFKKYYAS